MMTTVASIATPRWRAALVALAAALGLTFLVATPAGRAAAEQFLAQFRSQRLSVLPFDSSDRSMPFRELSELGTVTYPAQRGQGQRVANVDAAAKLVGFPLQRPDPATLPAGAGAPRVELMTGGETRFKLEQARAKEYFASIGRADLRLPERLDGSTLVIRLPAGVALTYGQSHPESFLMIGQFEQVTAGVEGKASLDEVRDFLLGLPSVSPATARQLRGIQDWRNTLPLPIPADQVRWSDVTVAGGQGLLFAEKGGPGNAVIWQRDGHIYAVAGSLGRDDLLRVANGLR